MSIRSLNEQEWADVRLEYETSVERPTLRELADKHRISRSTIFKRAAREKWKQNAVLMSCGSLQSRGEPRLDLRSKFAECQVSSLFPTRIIATWRDRYSRIVVSPAKFLANARHDSPAPISTPAGALLIDLLRLLTREAYVYHLMLLRERTQTAFQD